MTEQEKTELEPIVRLAVEQALSRAVINVCHVLETAMIETARRIMQESSETILGEKNVCAVPSIGRAPDAPDEVMSAKKL